jgi:D-glycero-D-manno-heptose 1,7-bisphosphate phosphatase
MTTDRPTPVLYLDIDGTVRQGKDDALGRFVNGPEDVVVFPEAVEMMRRWKAGGGRIIGVSNQGGIALGIVTSGTVAAAMRRHLPQAEQLFDKIAYCKAPPGRRSTPRWRGAGAANPKPGCSSSRRSTWPDGIAARSTRRTWA